MKKSWIIPIVLITSIGLSGCSSKGIAKEINKEYEVEQTLASEDSEENTYRNFNPITIEFMTEELMEEDIYKWKVTTPRFNGFDKITKLAGEVIAGTSKEYEFIKSLDEDEERINSFYFNVEPSIIQNKNGVLSFSLDMYDYTGGAHGNYWSLHYNYDLVKDRKIELHELFNESSDYQEILYTYLFSKMTNNEGFAENLKTYYYDKNEPLEYYISAGRLYIYFGVYAIGSYADGERIYEIPRDIIDNELSEYGKLVLIID